MRNKKLQIPFCCVNSEVLWRGEDALNNVIPIDKKIAQLNLDAIFTARPSDVPLIKAATNRIHIGVVYDHSLICDLEQIKKAGTDVLIFDDIDELSEFNMVEKAIDHANKLGLLILARVNNPLKINKLLLEKIQIIKWKVDQIENANSDCEEIIQKNIIDLKNSNPNLSIIYAAKKISTSLILNSLINGMDGIGEYSQCKKNYGNLDKLFHAVYDFKTVQEFINT